MGKRSPRDTTPPSRIIDWANEAERAFIEPKYPDPAPTHAAPRWYDLLEGEARDDFFGVPAAAVEDPAEPKIPGTCQPNGHYWWPSLPTEYGLPLLSHDMRERTLKTEGCCFRKKYDEGVRRIGTPEQFFDITAEKLADAEFWKNGPYVLPGSDRWYNGDLPGALTEEGFRIMDAMPSEPVEEEFDDLPIGGAVFGRHTVSPLARVCCNTI